MSADLAFMSAVELADNIRQKKVSSLEATENFFQRIDRLDPQLHSYLTLCQDQALADARAADDAVQRGGDLGPLHGVPISIKDLELTKGVTTTMGVGRVPRPGAGHGLHRGGAGESLRRRYPGQNQHA
jgi:Asp-tRNA(Asn)/Glu-tRNA(Gln) amidotransferase A subunit family amidase